MLEYEIVCRSTEEDLIGAVRLLIRSGWKPLGGMAPWISHGDVRYYQTLTRENPDAKDQ